MKQGESAVSYKEPLAADMSVKEYILHAPDAEHMEEIRQPLPVWKRIWELDAVRKIFLLFLMALFWQIYASRLDNDLVLPGFTATVAAFFEALASGELISRIYVSLKVLFSGYLCGILAATVLSIFAISSRIGTDLLDTLTSMFNPLPAIALLPLALLWFGLGTPSIVFVLIHAVLWPMALNTLSGFSGISPTLRLVGRNYGLTGPQYVFQILIPAAFPSIITGLKIGWAFAWRTLIAAELVFGVSSGSGGLGWFIYEKKNQLETASVFAGLFTVILVGILFENCVFRVLERRTVYKWGMRS
jgi:NitT/TauT family transport system permease protein